jgi:hypothetical protein
MGINKIMLGVAKRLFALAKRRRLPGTNGGPAAPGPAGASPALDPARLRELARTGAPDRCRWGDPSSYNPAWDHRARLAAPLIPDSARVLEIGVGVGVLRQLLRPRCDYVGADLEPLDPETTRLNLDCDPLPHERYDSIIALGVFEYLHCPIEVVAKIAAAADHIVLSYSCARARKAGGTAVLERHGWVNHFTEDEFVRLFAEHGLVLASRTPVNAAAEFEQVLFEFRRPAESRKVA